MSNQFVNGNIPLKSVFENIDINYREVESFVIERYPQAFKFDKIIKELGDGEYKRSGQRKFEIYYEGNTAPFQVVNARTVVGSNLRLTWQDPDWTMFRVGDLLQSENGVIGQVVTTIAGECLVRPFSTSAFVSADFAANEGVVTMGASVSTYNSTGVTERMTVPFSAYNVIGAYRNTATLYAEEEWEKTWVMDQNGNPYYARVKEVNALRDSKRDNYLRMLKGVRSEVGDQYLGGGIEWQIENFGGVAESYTSLDADAIQLQIQSMITNLGSTGSEYLVICGTGYLGQFQRNVATDLIRYAGNTNTIGGTEFKGINATMYSYLGKTLKFVVDESFDNTQMFAKMSTLNPGTTVQSNTAYFFDLSPVETKSGKVPFMRRYYYGYDGMFTNYVRGITDENGNRSQTASNDTTSTTFEIVYNQTTQLMNPAAHGYFSIAG